MKFTKKILDDAVKIAGYSHKYGECPGTACLRFNSVVEYYFNVDINPPCTLSTTTREEFIGRVRRELEEQQPGLGFKFDVLLATIEDQE